MVRTEDVSAKRRTTSSAPLRSAAKSPNFSHDPATGVRGLAHARTEFQERNCVRVAGRHYAAKPHIGGGVDAGVYMRARGWAAERCSAPTFNYGGPPPLPAMTLAGLSGPFLMTSPMSSSGTGLGSSGQFCDRTLEDPECK
jgi:hypothetical protein